MNFRFGNYFRSFYHKVQLPRKRLTVNLRARRSVAHALRSISPNSVASASMQSLDEIIRQGEKLLDTQIDNFRAIDTRAMQMMAGLGVIIIIGAGFSQSQNLKTILEIGFYRNMFLLLAISVITTLICCIIIIQSSTVSPPGNDPLNLLQDISDGYSLHEEKIEYIESLSRRQYLNGILLERNKKLLHLGSISWVITFVAIAGLIGFRLLISASV